MNVQDYIKAADRFWGKVDLGVSDDDCYIWTASRNKKGYGTIGIGGKTCLSHRVAWVFKHGSIPDGMLICHRCDEPACVNWRHLWIGTNRDNLDDMLKKGRSRHGENHIDAKLTERNVLAIRDDSRSLRQLSKVYGVGYGVIGQIKRREIWRHI